MCITFSQSKEDSTWVILPKLQLMSKICWSWGWCCTCKPSKVAKRKGYKGNPLLSGTMSLFLHLMFQSLGLENQPTTLVDCELLAHLAATSYPTAPAVRDQSISLNITARGREGKLPNEWDNEQSSSNALDQLLFFLFFIYSSQVEIIRPHD